jgi:hypothetical protein
LILFKSTAKMPAELSPAEADFFRGVGEAADLSLLLAQYQILFQGLTELARSEFQKTALEVTFVKITHAGQMIGLTELVSELKERRDARSGSSVVPSKSAGQTMTAAGALPVEKNISVMPPGAASVAKDWYELVQWVKKVKPPLGGYLNDAVPLLYSESRIEIAYPKASSSRQMVIERRLAVEEMLKQHFGKAVEFVVSEMADEGKKKS